MGVCFVEDVAHFYGRPDCPRRHHLAVSAGNTSALGYLGGVCSREWWIGDPWWADIRDSWTPDERDRAELGLRVADAFAGYVVVGYVAIP